MTIFRLVTIGAETGEDGAVPRKLDLTDCKRGRPDHRLLGAAEAAVAVS